MAIINYTDRIRYTGAGYLDAKLAPVQTAKDLENIQLTQRFEGLTITVLNNGNPQDYWLVGGISNKNWVPKNINNNDELKIILEDGFLKLLDGDSQLGDVVDLNDFFPSKDKDLYISNVEYVTTNDENNNGIFMCFTYSDETKKYLDMSQFLQKNYQSGSGIVIDNNIISIDDAIIGRIVKIENDITQSIKSIESINSQLSTITQIIENNKNKITDNTKKINELNDTVEELAGKISNPDNITISYNDVNSQEISVKISERDGNIINIEKEEGYVGLYAGIPVFYEDNELN